jgi:hypothetical protein
VKPPPAGWFYDPILKEAGGEFPEDFIKKGLLVGYPPPGV